MFCENCGNQINDGARFCNKCGATITGAQTPPAQSRASEKIIVAPAKPVVAKSVERASVSVCPNCDTPINAEGIFCKNCGATILPLLLQPVKSSGNKVLKGALISGTITIFVILAVFAGLYFFNDGFKRGFQRGYYGEQLTEEGQISRDSQSRTADNELNRADNETGVKYGNNPINTPTSPTLTPTPSPSPTLPTPTPTPSPSPTPASPTPTKYATIKGQSVILRASHSTTSNKLGYLEDKEQVIILGEYVPSNVNEAISNKSINLYNSNGAYLYTLPKGKAMKVLSNDGTKCKVSYDVPGYGSMTTTVSRYDIDFISGDKWFSIRRNTGEKGWVFSKFVQLNQ